MLKYIFALVFLYSSQAYCKTSIRYLATNYQGSVIAEFDQNSKSIAKYFYDAYGRELGTTHEGLGYIGSLYERDIDLLLLNERYYKAELRRFVSNDPIAFEINDTSSFNRYSYARNNPLKFIDPTGLRASGSICDYNAFCYIANFVGTDYSLPARYDKIPYENGSPSDGKITCDVTCQSIGKMLERIHSNQEAVAYYPGVAVTVAVTGWVLPELVAPKLINGAVTVIKSGRSRAIIAAILLEGSGASFTAAKGLRNLDLGEYFGKFAESVWVYHRQSGFKKSITEKDLIKGPP